MYEEVGVEYQFRRYRIASDSMDAFVEAWRDGVLPLRQSLGFEVVGAWVVDETNEFVWIIGHPGDLEEANRAYYSSPERAALDPDPARLIAEVEEHSARRVDR